MVCGRFAVLWGGMCPGSGWFRGGLGHGVRVRGLMGRSWWTTSLPATHPVLVAPINFFAKIGNDAELANACPGSVPAALGRDGGAGGCAHSHRRQACDAL